jgi:hypothetical protein
VEDAEAEVDQKFIEAGSSWTSVAAILTIIEGQFQVFQRFSGSKLALRTVESRHEALNYYENGSLHNLWSHCGNPSFGLLL